MIAVRPAAHDLEAYVEAWSSLAPDEPTSVEEQRDRLEREPRRLNLLVERDGSVVGCGFAGPPTRPSAASCCPASVPTCAGAGSGRSSSTSCSPT